ncbi:DUF721 domain-containing protein [Sneathiella aquimaris]|uniref:DUF721 domain-containing protein n=1 Tax=Sneathiella aquimaris TaxID=2599305 RepID=UPI00146EEEB9|nr:DciA family protein [Sneathiella aquimaris]
MRKVGHLKGPKAIGSYVGKTARAALVKRGFAQADILSHWQNVVGPTLYHFSSPERLTYSKNKNAEATLKVRVAPGHAPEFQHFEPLIIERINSFFGYKAVSRISIIQAPVKRAKKPKKTAPPEPTLEQKKWLEHSVKEVKDEELKAHLITLGAAILAKNNT